MANELMKDDSKRTWSEKWTKHRKITEKNKRLMEYPAETLVRLFKGRYVDNLPAPKQNLKIIDVSAGDGNNLIFIFNKNIEF